MGDQQVPAAEHKPIWSAEYYAMGKHLGIRCNDAREALLKCKDKYYHPEDCLKESAAYLRCASNLLTEIKSTSPDTFHDYAQCLDFWSFTLHKCRKQQQAFESAMPVVSQPGK